MSIAYSPPAVRRHTILLSCAVTLRPTSQTPEKAWITMTHCVERAATPPLCCGVAQKQRTMKSDNSSAPWHDGGDDVRSFAYNTTVCHIYSRRASHIIPIPHQADDITLYNDDDDGNTTAPISHKSDVCVWRRSDATMLSHHLLRSVLCVCVCVPSPCAELCRVLLSCFGGGPHHTTRVQIWLCCASSLCVVVLCVVACRFVLRRAARPAACCCGLLACGPAASSFRAGAWMVCFLCVSKERLCVCVMRCFVQRRCVCCGRPTHKKKNHDAAPSSATPHPAAPCCALCAAVCGVMYAAVAPGRGRGRGGRTCCTRCLRADDYTTTATSAHNAPLYTLCAVCHAEERERGCERSQNTPTHNTPTKEGEEQRQSTAGRERERVICCAIMLFCAACGFASEPCHHDVGEGKTRSDVMTERYHNAAEQGGGEAPPQKET